MRALFTMIPHDAVALTSTQAVSFFTYRTRLINWLDKNPKSSSEELQNKKAPVSKRREQVRRAQKYVPNDRHIAFNIFEYGTLIDSSLIELIVSVQRTTSKL